MTMPNFLIIGAARSGTTSLHHYLGQHPDIYMSPVKEPSFFAIEDRMLRAKMAGRQEGPQSVTMDLTSYLALFEGSTGETAVGEVSPVYLHAPGAPGRIRHHIPDARLIAILRDPVERAYSGYLSRVVEWGWPLDGFAQGPLTARQVLAERETWWSQSQRYGYIVKGHYHVHLGRYLNMFDRGQIKVYLYQDFKTDTVGMLQDLYQFLGVDATFVPDTSMRHGVTGIPKNKVWHALSWSKRLAPFKTVIKSFLPVGLKQRIDRLTVSNRVRPPLAPEVRQAWIEVYRDDILQLQDLIGHDLSAWLE